MTGLASFDKIPCSSSNGRSVAANATCHGEIRGSNPQGPIFTNKSSSTVPAHLPLSGIFFYCSGYAGSYFNQSFKIVIPHAQEHQWLYIGIVNLVETMAGIRCEQPGIISALAPLFSVRPRLWCKYKALSGRGNGLGDFAGKQVVRDTVTPSINTSSTTYRSGSSRRAISNLAISALFSLHLYFAVQFIIE